MSSGPGVDKPNKANHPNRRVHRDRYMAETLSMPGVSMNVKDPHLANWPSKEEIERSAAANRFYDPK